MKNLKDGIVERTKSLNSKKMLEKSVCFMKQYEKASKMDNSANSSLSTQQKPAIFSLINYFRLKSFLVIMNKWLYTLNEIQF